MRRWSSTWLFLSAAAAGLLGAGARPQSTGATAPQAVQIRHEAARCFMAERYPLVDACFEPSAPVDARVYFRAEASARWHSVVMRPVGACYRGTLPRPLADSGRVVYYLTASVPGRAEARTTLQSALVVTDEKACPGPVGPFLSAAGVNVEGGSLPAGFISIEGPVSHAAKKVIAVVVGAGAIGVGVALGAKGSGGTGSTGSPATTVPPPASTSTTVISPPTTTTTTTTTLPPPITTTTTLPPPTTTTTTVPPPTTTTTTRPPPPTTTTTTSTTTTTTQPPPTTTTTTSTTTTSTTSTTTTSTTSTTTTSTTTTTTLPTTTTTTAPTTTTTTAPTTTTTTVPATTTTTVPATTSTTTTTTTAPAAATRLARTTVTTLRRMLAMLRHGDGPDARPEPVRTEPARAPARWVWTSELAVGGGRGQVVVNGAQVSYPGPGRNDLVVAAHPGTNTVEVVLVDGAGRPGTWAFTLASGTIRGGSLRVLAGEAAAVGAQELVLRLHGRPGERAVFSFEGE